MLFRSSSTFQSSWNEASAAALGDGSSDPAGQTGWEPPPSSFQPVKKNWRVKRTAVPRWYKQRAGVRSHVQSGAARVARFRPRPSTGR